MRTLAVILIAIALAPGAVAQSRLNPDDYYGVYPGVDLEAIIGTPTAIDVTVEQDPTPQAELRSTGDTHGVFDLPIDALAATITDLANYQDFVPRTEYSSATRIAEDPPTWRYHFVLAFRVAFFSRTYETISVFEDQSARVLAAGAPPGTRAFFYRLEDSVDGQLSATGGAWYLQPVRINGREYTYARHAMSSDYRETPFGLKFALRNFSENELTTTMSAFVSRTQHLTNGGAR